MVEKRKYGLLEEDIESIISALKENTKIKKIILFGSRAKGSNFAGSDIDIAIQGNTLRLDDILEAKISYEKLSLPYKMDIVILERVKEPELLAHIERVGITLFERKE